MANGDVNQAHDKPYKVCEKNIHPIKRTILRRQLISSSFPRILPQASVSHWGWVYLFG